MAQGKKTGGRTKGTPNKTTTELGQACRRLVEDRAYRAAFKLRLHAGELAPPLEAMVWHYAYGKPLERHEVGGEGGGPVRVEFVIVGGHA